MWSQNSLRTDGHLSQENGWETGAGLVWTECCTQGLIYTEDACEVLDEYHLFRPGVVGTLGPLLRNLRNTKNFMQMYFYVGTKANSLYQILKGMGAKKGLRPIYSHR